MMPRDYWHSILIDPRQRTLDKGPLIRPATMLAALSVGQWALTVAAIVAVGAAVFIGIFFD